MKSDIVIRKGEIADEFYIIKEGKVEVLAEDNEGNFKLISILE